MGLRPDRALLLLSPKQSGNALANGYRHARPFKPVASTNFTVGVLHLQYANSCNHPSIPYPSRIYLHKGTKSPVGIDYEISASVCSFLSCLMRSGLPTSQNRPFATNAIAAVAASSSYVLQLQLLEPGGESTFTAGANGLRYQKNWTLMQFFQPA